MFFRQGNPDPKTSLPYTFEEVRELLGEGAFTRASFNQLGEYDTKEGTKKIYVSKVLEFLMGEVVSLREEVNKIKANK